MRHAIILILLVLPGYSVIGQITGNTSSNLGVTETYSYTNSFVIVPEWQATNGTVISTGVVGSTYSASITWNNQAGGSVSFFDNGGLLSTVSVTVGPPYPSVPTFTNGFSCGTAPLTVLLSATPGANGNTIQWWNSATSRNPNSLKGTGLTFTTPSISTTTTYYIETYNTTTALSSSRVAITASIYAAAGSPSGLTGGSRCGTGNVSLSGTPGTNGTSLKWYAASSGGSPLHSGTTYVPSVSSTTTYYVCTVTANGCEGGRSSVTATVNPLPGLPTGGTINICGAGSPTITPTLGNNANSAKWYTASTGGTLLSTGVTYSPFLSSTTTYFVSGFNSTTGCESTTRTGIVVTVNSVPSTPSATNIMRFGGGNVSLTATGGTAYQWYDNSNTILTGETGATLKRHVSSTTSFKVKKVGTGGCESSAYTVTATIYPLPLVTPAGSTILASGATRVLNAQSGYSSYQWKKNGANISGATSSSYTATAFGQYSVRVTISDATARESDPLRITVLGNTPQTPSIITPYCDVPDEVTTGTRKNFVRTYVAKIKTTDTADFEIANFNKNKVTVSTQYLDGLGMPVQMVVKQGSPTSEDIVQHMEYDPFARVPREYLPYSSTATTDADGYRMDAKRQQYLFYQAGAVTGATCVPFAEKSFEASPLSRVVMQSTPGEAWKMGSGHEVKSNSWAYYPDVDGIVIYWTIDATDNIKLLQTGTYSAGELHVDASRDEDDKEVRTYKDQEGRIVLRKVKSDGNVWFEIYYVYDNFDNLRYVLPPEAVRNLPGSFVWATHKSTIIDPWVYQYRYDERKRQIKKKVPSAGWVYTVYDKLDRPVMMQDAVQRSNNKWSFIKYDILGRPVLTGIVSDTRGYDTIRTSHSAQVSYETKTTTNNEYTYTNALPHVAKADVLTKTFYDDYALSTGFTSDYNFVTELGQSAPATRLTGQITALVVMDLQTGDSLRTKSYYDKRNHPIQSNADNIRGYIDRSTIRYVGTDFTQKPDSSKTVHNVGEASQKIIKRKFIYDHADRMLEVHHVLSGQNPVLLMKNDYNAIGQVIRKNVHSTDGGETFLQKLDYEYNIRGMLIKINDAALSGDFPDQFGMELFYETGVSQVNYNGNISGVRWNTAHDGKQRSYGYVYDNSNRLLLGEHALKNTISGNWTDEAGRYNEQITGYDYNGNITGLDRWATSGKIDALAYTYSGNRLLRVEDSEGTEGFNNRNSGSNDYDFDKNGSINKDLNKNVSAIEYNHLNLPKKITQSGTGNYLVYHYDATGRKLQQKLYNSSNVLQKTTQYIGEFIYENDTLKFINHEEGRLVNSLVIPDATEWQYQYHLKDHLGNVRVTVGGSSAKYLATAETAVATQENATFQNLASSTHINSSLYNHTAGGSYSIRLSGINSEIIGPAKSFAVNDGDYFDIHAYAKFFAATTTNTTVVGNIAGAITAAFGVSSLSTGDAYQAYQSLNTIFTSGPFIGSGEWEDDDAPKAYLNYILFDEDFVPYDYGFDQVNAAAEEDGTGVLHDHLNLRARATQKGFIYIYLSNENNKVVDVYFDDVLIEETRVEVVQTSDYYGFGMEIKDTNYTKTDAFGNQDKYNGKENQDELGLELLDYGARFYDASIGRWGVVDPLADHPNQIGMSPYSAFWNNPILYDDPDGQCPNCATAAIGAGIGALIGGGVEIGMQLYNNGSVDNWSAVGGSALQGGITGGAAGFTGGASLLVTAGVVGGANAVGGAANRAIQGQETTLMNVATDATVGAVLGAGGKLVGNAVSSGTNNLSNSAKGKLGEAITEIKYGTQGYKSAGKAEVLTGGRTATGNPAKAVYDHKMTNVITGKQITVESKFNGSKLTPNQSAAQSRVSTSGGLIIDRTTSQGLGNGAKTATVGAGAGVDAQRNKRP